MKFGEMVHVINVILVSLCPFVNQNRYLTYILLSGVANVKHVQKIKYMPFCTRFIVFTLLAVMTA